MDRQALFVSRTLDASARALANWTVTRLEEVAQGLPDRYGQTWREHWLAEVRMRAASLAQAIAVGRPALFVGSVTWSRQAFASRDASVADLRASLECLRDVLSTELPADAASLSASYLQAAIDALDDSSDAAPLSPADDPANHPLVLRYLEPVLSGRQTDAEAYVLSAVEDGMSVKDAYEKILQPAQRALGLMWHRGEITVADEHAGTVVTVNVMAQLRRHFTTLPPNGKRLAAMAAPGDLHELGVRMITDYFQMDGWETLFLGCNVPVDDVISTLNQRGVDLVAIGASSLLHVRAVGELIDVLRADASTASVKIIVGGPPFNAVEDLWQEVGADASAPSAREAVEVGRALIFGA